MAMKTFARADAAITGHEYGTPFFHNGGRLLVYGTGSLSGTASASVLLQACYDNAGTFVDVPFTALWTPVATPAVTDITPSVTSKRNILALANATTLFAAYFDLPPCAVRGAVYYATGTNLILDMWLVTATN